VSFLQLFSPTPLQELLRTSQSAQTSIPSGKTPATTALPTQKTPLNPAPATATTEPHLEAMRRTPGYYKRRAPVPSNAPSEDLRFGRDNMEYSQQGKRRRTNFECRHAHYARCFHCAMCESCCSQHSAGHAFVSKTAYKRHKDQQVAWEAGASFAANRVALVSERARVLDLEAEKAAGFAGRIYSSF
jgi:hypothetical protein